MGVKCKVVTPMGKSEFRNPWSLKLRCTLNQAPRPILPPQSPPCFPFKVTFFPKDFEELGPFLGLLYFSLGSYLIFVSEKWVSFRKYCIKERDKLVPQKNTLLDQERLNPIVLESWLCWLRMLA